MILDIDGDRQVTIGAAFTLPPLAGHLETRTGFNSTGNFDRKCFNIFRASLAATVGTGIVDNLPRAAALTAGFADAEKALLIAYLAGSATGWADLGVGAGP